MTETHQNEQVTASKPATLPPAAGEVMELQTARFLTPDIVVAKSAETPRLNSLAQVARGQQLNSARGILLFVGVCTLLFNGVMFFMIEGQVRSELRKQGLEHINRAELQPVLITAYAIQGGLILMGVGFIVLGLLVNTYPVPCTIVGLLLYVVGFVATVMFDPEPVKLGGAIVVKVFIGIWLAKAIGAAIAYERGRTPEAAA